MKNFKFNIEEAIQFSKEGCLEEWIHIFLRTFGGNLALSEGLKLEKRNWTGPALVPINQLIRCCGPEEGMEYHNSYDDWEERISNFCKLIEDGWEYAPLIAENKEEKLVIRDGNHRLEAMNRLGFKECWVIVWSTD